MAPFSLTNRFIAPTFENGVNGWTVTGTGGGTATLSTSTAYSLHGTKCLKVSIPAGTGSVRLVPPSFPMVLDPYRMFGLSFSVASTTASAQVSYGFERFKPDHVTYHNQSVTASPTITSTMTKLSKLDSLGPSNAAFIGGLLPKITINQTAAAQEYYFDGFTWLDGADQELYPFRFDTTLFPQIAGSWATDSDYDYSWTGAAEASTSVATHIAELVVPAAFNRGDTIAVTGTGFPASSTVAIAIDDVWGAAPLATVATDSSGNVSTSVTVPHTLNPGKAYIVGKPASGAVGSMTTRDVWTNPTDLSTVTNYFPNPNGQTLAVDGVTPKYYAGTYTGDALTRVSVGGEYRTRFDPALSNVAATLGPASLTTLGLDATKQYLIKARLHSASISNDRFAYIQTSSGNSDNALTGPSPWDLIGTGTGAFSAPGQLLSYSWPDGSTVDIDQVSIINGATYLMSWVDGLKPGTVLDGYQQGLRPGREYQMSGYTYGTFKVRTGTSAGSLTDAIVWTNTDPDVWTGGVLDKTFAIPEGHTVIQLEASGPESSYISIYDYVPYFDGDTPDGGGYTYSWAGTPHDSASIRAVAASGPTAKVFLGGIGVDVTEMRVVINGTLINVTEAGG